MLKLQAKGVAIWADEHHWTVHCACWSEWSTFHLHLCISYQWIWGCQHLQKPSTKCNFTYIFWLYLFRSGAPPLTLRTVGARTDPRDRFKRAYDRYKAGWCWPGGPPNKNPGHAITYQELWEIEGLRMLRWVRANKDTKCVWDHTVLVCIGHY